LFETEESASFLKKRLPAGGSKKLLIPAGLATVGAKCRRNQKFFERFFSKKRCFLLTTPHPTALAR
jgi:hypothetical protein